MRDLTADLAAFFASKDCKSAPETLLLQPTELFLDHADRDVRRRFYMLRDIAGRNFFLRPDFTLPLAQERATKNRRTSKRFYYAGPVFRFDVAKDRLIRRMQAGIEFFGDANDAELVALASEAVQRAGLAGSAKPLLRLGDAGLFAALTRALEIPDYWQRHLQSHFRRTPGQNPSALALPAVRRFLDLPDEPEALARWWQSHTIPPIGARSRQEIAARLAALHALARPRGKKEMALLEAFLKINAPPYQAIKQIARLTRQHGIDLQARLDALVKFFDALAAHGIDMRRARFATGFAGSDLGYYTGFLFSIYGAKREILAAGGRYDGLLAALGARGKLAKGAGAAIYLSQQQSAPPQAPRTPRASIFIPAAGRLVVGLPSKGRIAEDARRWLGERRLDLSKADDRTFSLSLKKEGVELVFLPAAEIAHQLVQGQIHLGLTGMDLARETDPNGDGLMLLEKLPFSHAKLTLAVPQCWVDVDYVSDLDEAASAFRRLHGRRMRIATKYPRLARSFLSQHGLIAYRLVESLGATESAPSQMTAEAILDITSTGKSLKANGLKALKEEGSKAMLEILSSQAALYASPDAAWTHQTIKAAQALRKKLKLGKGAKALEALKATKTPA